MVIADGPAPFTAGGRLKTMAGERGGRLPPLCCANIGACDRPNEMVRNLGFREENIWLA